MTMSTYLKDGLANYVFNGVAAPTQPTVWYIKCHTGDPGGTGTANASVAYPTRVQVTGGGDWSASSGGVVQNSAAVTFTNAVSGETVSHVSVWDHATAGNCLGYGALSPSKAVLTGESLNFAINAITITFS